MNPDLQQSLVGQLAALPSAGALRVCVAYSGGLDSTVLLHLLAGLREQSGVPGFELRALHVNHGLSDYADEWEAECAASCRRLDVPFTAFGVEVARTDEMGLEAAARESRYAVFEQSLEDGEYLLLAQHQDDQLETVLLQLMRGAGVKGLAAMPAEAALGAGRLLRPLLECSRQDLAVYGEQHGLQWIDDPSNFDTGFDRNFLRHEVLPVLKRRWPSAALTTARSARWCAEADALCAALAETDAADVLQGRRLSVAGLLALAPARQRNLLRYAITSAGLALPPETRLQEVLGSMLVAAEDAAPVVDWPGVSVRRYRGELFVLPQAAVAAPSADRFELPADERLNLGGAAGSLQLTAGDSGLRLRLNALPLTVRFRQGGERLRPAGGDNSRSLKNLLQEGGVLPWMRGALPLLYAGDELIAIADIWVAEGWQAAAGEAGYTVDWRPAGEVVAAA